MTENTQQTSQAAYSTPDGTFNQLRIETQDIIERFEQTLRGKISEFRDLGDGNIQVVEKKIGEPIINQKGMSHLLSFVYPTFSRAVVMGNWDQKQYREELYEINLLLWEALLLNRPYWGVNPKAVGLIIGTFMVVFSGFLSRLINNEERKSYVGLVKESNTIHSYPEQKRRLGF